MGEWADLEGQGVFSGVEDFPISSIPSGSFLAYKPLSCAERDRINSYRPPLVAAELAAARSMQWRFCRWPPDAAAVYVMTFGDTLPSTGKLYFRDQLEAICSRHLDLGEPVADWEPFVARCLAGGGAFGGLLFDE